MKTTERKEQIIRIQSQSRYREINESLEKVLQVEATRVTKATVEAALIEEVKAHREKCPVGCARRSGYYQRSLDSQYGRIEKLNVPKLRQGNGEREWSILTRYERFLGNLLDYCLGLYVMGLSLRDLQEALYGLLGNVLSVSAVNRITLKAEKQMNQHRYAAIEDTPPILIVDGVWVSIQYASEERWEDKAGHCRKLRQAQDSVILVAMAIWPDGTQQILHYEVASQESQEHWENFFENLVKRGFNSEQVKLVVSDGTTGLPPVLAQYLPRAQHQRCITHKVRAMLRHLDYDNLPTHDEEGHKLSKQEAKKQRFEQIQTDAYDIYKAADWLQAVDALKVFFDRWYSLEPKALKTFLYDIDLTFNFYDFDPSLHSLIRTSNALERFFREFRNKADEIGAFPNQDSCLTLFFLILQRYQAKHDRIKTHGE
jgi:transposase-like protein